MSSAQRVSPVGIHRVGSVAGYSESLAHACAGFGVLPVIQGSVPPRSIPPTRETLNTIHPGIVMLIAGPSGAGKSSSMRGIAHAIRPDRIRVVPGSLSPAEHRRACFDLLSGDMQTRTHTLSLAGLAEPMLWARPAGVLSEGERARLRLAMGMHGALPGDVVLADELASTIDRASAHALCSTVRRWAHRRRISFIGASAHEDLEGMLAPDVVLDARTQKTRKPSAIVPQPIRIEQGTTADYNALAHLHYRSGTPATTVRILRAVRSVPFHVDPDGEIPAGVLVVSMPTLNGAWRKRAWPDVFGSVDKRRNAHALNEHVRTISRVIVDPRSRGLGVATRLVRAYLDDPITAGTEASAAMGDVCPFFERAGMTPYPLGHDLIDTRLLDALSHLGLTPARLTQIHVRSGSLLMRELITWGKQRKLLPSGSAPREEVQRLTPSAACRLCSRPRAYAYTKGDRGDEAENT
jgi:ABC-type iron transport system FetAB ATPase subunit/GNAT superfamily N-acetyltransferase